MPYVRWHEDIGVGESTPYTLPGGRAIAPSQRLRVWCQLNFPQRTIGVMLRTTRVRASISSRTASQNVVFKVSQRSRAGGDARSARDAARLCSFADQLPLVLGKRGED